MFLKGHNYAYWFTADSGGIFPDALMHYSSIESVISGIDSNWPDGFKIAELPSGVTQDGYGVVLQQCISVSGASVGQLFTAFTTESYISTSSPIQNDDENDWVSALK